MNMKQKLRDASVHDWYRFVLAFPDHLVTLLLDKFGAGPGDVVLDPFVGTGTTLVECKKRGISSIGIDANPVAAFASRVKTRWDIDLEEFDRRRWALLGAVREALHAASPGRPFQLSFADLEHPPAVRQIREGALEGDVALESLLPKNWISPLPLRKALLIREHIERMPDDSITDIFRLALANVVVAASNLGFGPEVYVKKKRQDADVYGVFEAMLRRMRHDLEGVRSFAPYAPTWVYYDDARCLASFLKGPINFVITSPPYPNEKDYTRTTRLELIMLGFIKSKKELRQLKQRMLRSHTRNIYKADNDSVYVADIPEIQQVAQEIERRRVERGATSGFERLYHRVVTEYFGGMHRVLEQLERVMLPGGQLAFVVGDQMSYFRVPIHTAKLLSLVARRLHYREVETILWRTRRATATNIDIKEQILILERT